jgi:hypothetical protein
MQTRLSTHLAGLALAILCTMLVGSARAGDSKLAGTWEVAVTFPQETCDRLECKCTAGTFQTLNTFLKDGAMVWSGGNLRAGTGQGAWKSLGHHSFMARFKFSMFDFSTGGRTGSEEVTKGITLTGPDTFEAPTTYDLFDAAGGITAQGCSINETATRFE